MPGTKTAVHPTGLRITFDEGPHTYVDEHETVYTSGTTLLKKVFAPFDFNRVAAEMAAKKGCPEDEVKAEWTNAGRFGTRVHTVAEECILGVQPSLQPESEKERLAMECAWSTASWIRQNWTPMQPEMIVFSPRYGVAGTIDLPVIDTDGVIWLCDWKTNKKIYRHGFNGQMAKPPIGHLGDCNWEKYCLQLSLYERILRDEGYIPAGSRVKRSLIWIPPFESKPVWMETPDRSPEIREILLQTMWTRKQEPPF